MSRRSLLLALVVVVAVVSLLFVLRSRGGSSAASATSTPTPVPGSRHKGPKPTPTIPVDTLHLRSYAATLIPVVDRATLVFDKIAGGAARMPNLSALSTACGHATNRVDIQENYVDGVPHPYLWYSSAGQLHHELLGIYHDMLSAAVVCQTTAGNGDQSGASGAVASMATNAHKLHAMSIRLHHLASQPH